jgi:hypothetical protein
MNQKLSNSIPYPGAPTHNLPQQDPPVPHYFDGTGLLWIMACVAFALAAAHFLPWAERSDAPPVATKTTPNLPKPL